MSQIAEYHVQKTCVTSQMDFAPGPAPLVLMEYSVIGRVLKTVIVASVRVIVANALKDVKKMGILVPNVNSTVLRRALTADVTRIHLCVLGV